MAVPSRLFEWELSELIDGEAGKRFRCSTSVTAARLRGIHRDALSGLANGVKTSSRGYLPDVLVVAVGYAVKTGFTVTNLLHNVDLVL